MNDDVAEVKAGPPKVPRFFPPWERAWVRGYRSNTTEEWQGPLSCFICQYRTSATPTLV